MSYRRGSGGDSDDESTVVDHRDVAATDAFRAHYGGQGQNNRAPAKQKAQGPEGVGIHPEDDFENQEEDEEVHQHNYYGGGNTNNNRGGGGIYQQQQQQPGAAGLVEVGALQEEVRRLRDALSATSQGTAEANYLQQLKKARDLTVKLEVERSKVAKLQNQMVHMEREKMLTEQQDKKGILLPSQKSPNRNGAASTVVGGESDADILAKELSENKDRLERSGRLVANLRKQNEDLKRDLFKMKKILSTEIGDQEIVERAIVTIQALQQDPPLGSDVEGSTILNGGGAAASTIAGGKPPTVLGGAQSSVASAASVINSVGGGTSMSTANNKEPGWRGRAQQITLLKSKVKELERFKEQTVSQMGGGSGGAGDGTTPRGGYDDSATVRSATTTQIRDGPIGGGTRSVAGSVRTNATGRTDFDDVNRDRVERTENKKKLEVRELKMAIDDKVKEVDKEKTRADSLSARLQILERDNQHLKVCMSKVLEKTDNDDKLIAEYQDKIAGLNEEIREAYHQQQQSGGGGYRVVQAQPQQQPTAQPTAGSGGIAFDAAAQREVSTLKANIAQLHTQLAEEKQLRAQQQQQETIFNKARGGYNHEDDDSDDEGYPAGPSSSSKNKKKSQNQQQSLDIATVGDKELQQLLDLADQDPEASLSKAVEIIDLQRCTLLAFNDQLTEGKEKMTSSYLAKLGGMGSADGMAKHTREENIYLKERLRDLTKLMDREVALHKQIATRGGMDATQSSFASGFAASNSRPESQINQQRGGGGQSNGDGVGSFHSQQQHHFQEARGDVDESAVIFEKREYMPSGSTSQTGSARQPGGGVPLAPKNSGLSQLNDSSRRQVSSAPSQAQQQGGGSSSSSVVKLPAVAGRRKSTRPDSQTSTNLGGDTPPQSRGSMDGNHHLDDGLEEDGYGVTGPSPAMQKEAANMKSRYAELQKNTKGGGSTRGSSGGVVGSNSRAPSGGASGKPGASRLRTQTSQVS